MRAARDSFLMFLNSELTGITIHSLFTDPSNPGLSQLQQNALNVEFLNSNFDRHVNEELVSLSVIYEKELDAVSTMEQVFDLLSKKFYTQQYDFTIPSSPVAIDGNVVWNNSVIRFRKIPSSLASHFNCTFSLRFYRSLN